MASIMENDNTYNTSGMIQLPDGASISTARTPALIPIALAPGITVHYTTRLGGHSQGDWAFCNLGSKVGDDPSHVYANRFAVDGVVGSRVYTVSQIHSARAVSTDDELERIRSVIGAQASDGSVPGPKGEAGGESFAEACADRFYGIEADAQYTLQQDRAIGVFTADCLPVLLADPHAGIIGAAHCGRKGLQRGVLQNLIHAMESRGARSSHMAATLGPCICGSCYEVGSDIADEFDRQFPGTATVTRFGGKGIDITLAALQILAHEGISGSRIADSGPRVRAATYYLETDPEFQALCRADAEGGPLSKRLDKMEHPLCTLENPLWYSHRRAVRSGKADSGRALSIITRTDPARLEKEQAALRAQLAVEDIAEAGAESIIEEGTASVLDQQGSKG